MSSLERRESKSNSAIPVLIISFLGVAVIVAGYFLIPGFQTLDLILLLCLVAFVAAGATQNIIRGLATAAIVYLASSVAAIFYTVLQPYAYSILQMPKFVGIPTGGNADALAFSFLVLWVIVWIILEVIGRASFPDTRLPALGFLDRVGGLFIYLVVGVVIVALLFNAIGYSQIGRRAHNEALLRSTFNQVLHSYYTAQSFWFLGRPPAIYAYDLDLERAR